MVADLTSRVEWFDKQYLDTRDNQLYDFGEEASHHLRVLLHEAGFNESQTGLYKRFKKKDGKVKSVEFFDEKGLSSETKKFSYFKFPNPQPKRISTPEKQEELKWNFIEERSKALEEDYSFPVGGSFVGGLCAGALLNHILGFDAIPSLITMLSGGFSGTIIGGALYGQHLKNKIKRFSEKYKSVMWTGKNAIRQALKPVKS